MRFASHMFGHIGGGDGHMQDVVAVLVTHNREGDEVLAVAGDQDRSLECEVDESFQDARREATTTVGAGADLLQVGVGTQHELTVAVVAAGHGLQHGRIMDLVEGGVKLIEVVDSAPRCGGGAVVVDELLLVHAVLGHAQQVGAAGWR